MIRPHVIRSLPSTLAVCIVALVATITPGLAVHPTNDLRPPVAQAATFASRIAFVSERERDRAEIFLMSPDGTQQTNITLNEALDFVPAWSPDASRIAFDSNKGDNWDIYVMESDGRSVFRLTDNPAIDRKTTWSPDGQYLAFESLRDGDWNIYRMRADGTEQHALTILGTTDQQPAWSPDGTRIAFVSDRAGNMDVYVMDRDGGQVTQLTGDSQGEWTPAWSPDGTRIAFTSYSTGNGDIYLMNADGSGQTRLTTSSALDEWPTWSPDGTRIAFESERDGNREIYVMEADGTEQTRLTFGGAKDLHAAWSPFLRPGLNTISPASAVANAGNVPVVIRGRNLRAPVSGRLGPVALSDVTLVSETEIQAVVPVGELGQGGVGGAAYDVTVVSAGEEITLPKAFTVKPVVRPTQFRAMVYLACDNNLDREEQPCFELVNRLEEAVRAQPDLQIAILWDGAKLNDSAYYLIQPDASPLWASYVEGVNRFSIGEINSGDWRSLVGFAGWAQSQYPGEYKMLSLVGHGGGWAPDQHPDQGRRWRRGQPGEELGGMLLDENPESFMSTADLARALEAISAAYPLSLVYLDACLMSTIEVIAEIAPYTQYIVAHENLTWSHFPYDGYFRSITHTTTPLTLATTIAQINKGYWSAAGYPSQISVIDTAVVPQLLGRLETLALVLSDTLTLQRDQILAIARATARVDENGNGLIDGVGGDDLIDLGDFSSRLAADPALPGHLRTAASELQTTLNTAVLINYRLSGQPWYARQTNWELDQLSGFSIYFPTQDEWKRPYYGDEALPRFAGAWTDFTQQVFAGQQAPTHPGSCTDAPCEIGFGPLPLPIKVHLPMLQR